MSNVYRDGLLVGGWLLLDIAAWLVYAPLGLAVLGVPMMVLAFVLGNKESKANDR